MSLCLCVDMRVPVCVVRLLAWTKARLPWLSSVLFVHGYSPPDPCFLFVCSLRSSVSCLFFPSFLIRSPFFTTPPQFNRRGTVLMKTAQSSQGGMEQELGEADASALLVRLSF